jgi:hypothetical protein
MRGPGIIGVRRIHLKYPELQFHDCIEGVLEPWADSCRNRLSYYNKCRGKRAVNTVPASLVDATDSFPP